MGDSGSSRRWSRPGAGVAAGLVLAALAAGPGGAVTNGQQAGSFLLIAAGARATGMGEAFTGVADDVSAMSWNAVTL